MNRLIRNFGYKEFIAIGGRKGWNVFLLIAISFSALLVLGFAESVELFLKSKMDNKYVQLVDVNWPKTIADCREEDPLENFREMALGRFHVSGVHGIVTSNVYFASNDNNLSYGTVGFVAKKSDILNVLIADSTEFVTDYRKNSLLRDNGAKGRETLSSKEGVVVSRAFLNKLGLSNDATSIDIHVECGFHPLSLPIAAILKNLPSEIDVIMHQDLFEGIDKARDESLSPETWNKRLEASKDTYFMVPSSVWKDVRGKYASSFFNERMSPSYEGGRVLRHKRGKSLPSSVASFKWVNPSEVLGLEVSGVESTAEASANPSVIGVMFEEPDSVRDFADWVQNDTNFFKALCPSDDVRASSQCAVNSSSALKVDLSKIKSKEFLVLFRQIARLLRFFLMLSASALLIMRCNALFQLHIEKNRASLGTLKAFGLSNGKIIGLYAGIAVLMLLAAFIVSIVALAAFGPITIELAKSILSIRPEDAVDLTYRNMDLMHGFAAFVLLPIAFVSNRIRKLLRLSPGALVFGRKTTST